jgi:hypothetical protein
MLPNADHGTIAKQSGSVADDDTIEPAADTDIEPKWQLFLLLMLLLVIPVIIAWLGWLGSDDY